MDAPELLPIYIKPHWFTSVTMAFCHLLSVVLWSNPWSQGGHFTPKVELFIFLQGDKESITHSEDVNICSTCILNVILFFNVIFHITFSISAKFRCTFVMSFLLSLYFYSLSFKKGTLPVLPRSRNLKTSNFNLVVDWSLLLHVFDIDLTGIQNNDQDVILL